MGAPYPSLYKAVSNASFLIDSPDVSRSMSSEEMLEEFDKKSIVSRSGRSSLERTCFACGHHVGIIARKFVRSTIALAARIKQTRILLIRHTAKLAKQGKCSGCSSGECVA